MRTMPPHVIAKPPATRAYTLWDRKADREPVTNWSYVPMPEEALSRLQVGDAVRLLLMDSDGGSCWSKVYFEITSIDYYSKGQSGKARKFRGRAMDTVVSTRPREMRSVFRGGTSWRYLAGIWCGLVWVRERRGLQAEQHRGGAARVAACPS